MGMTILCAVLLLVIVVLIMRLGAERPDELSEVAAELLRTRSGRRNINEAARDVLDHERALDKQLRDMVTRVEVAQEDLARRDQAYLDHITKVRACLGDVRSEDDVYEAIKRAGHMKALCTVALRNAGLIDDGVLAMIEERAEQLAAMETRNAELFRENVRLAQELEDAKELGTKFAELHAAIESSSGVPHTYVDRRVL